MDGRTDLLSQHDSQAGGLANSGTQRILDIQPKGIHERTGIFLGSKEDVEDVLSFYK